jgi:chromate transport protein ChrA
MSDEQQPAKRVVKRVVKKTVVRPPSAREPEPQVRYGRPVTGTTARPKAKAATAKPSKQRAKLELGGKVKGVQKVISSRGSNAASGVAGVARSAAGHVGSRIARGGRAVRDWRIPRWDPLPASIFTGAVAGLVGVGLGLAALVMFTHLRGVASGGGRCGSLTFVVVAFIAFVVGELLLSAFGSAQARITSFLGVVLTIVAILGLFLGVLETAWALVLVPVLGAVTYAISYGLLNLAETYSEDD